MNIIHINHMEDTMQAYSTEDSAVKGILQLEKLFEFVVNNADELESYSMESNIYAKVMEIGMTVMQAYFQAKGTGDIGLTLTIDDGTVLKRGSQLRTRKYFSIFGKFDVYRTYYFSKGQQGVFPLDASANLPTRCYSYLLQKWMNLFSVRDSFDESSESLCNLLNINITQSNFEVVNRESAEDYEAFYLDKELPAHETEGELQVVQFDGKGVPMIKKEAAKIQARLGKGEKRAKKKEATVGVDYTVDRNVRTPEDVANNLVYPDQSESVVQPNEKKTSAPHAQNIRRFASLEHSREEVMDEIVSYAKKRNSDNKRPWVAVMDGALCLWTALSLALSGIPYVGILDIIHVVEYLWKVGNCLHGEKTPGAKKWVYAHLLAILQGRVGYVIGGLKQVLTKREKKLSASQVKAINKAITYFDNHRKWMKYDQYLKEGYPIGSGVVESTCGHTVKSRMEGTGRRWSLKGAEPMLLLRSIYTSSDWKEYHIKHMDEQRLKNYPYTDHVMEASDDYSCKLAA